MRERRQEKKQVFKVKLLRLPAKVDQDSLNTLWHPGLIGLSFFLRIFKYLEQLGHGHQAFYLHF